MRIRDWSSDVCSSDLFHLPPALQPVVKAAFTLAPDDDPVVEDLGQHNYAIVAVGEVVEAAPRPLNQIREQVAADLVRSRAFDKAKETAEMVVAKRSEERRVGKEGVSPCRSGWSTSH